MGGYQFLCVIQILTHTQTERERDCNTEARVGLKIDGVLFNTGANANR